MLRRPDEFFDHIREILRNLTQIVESGGLKPVLDENRYSLEEVGLVHARLESGQAMGKVVVENCEA
jgi:NADPH2:quinone reductase